MRADRLISLLMLLQTRNSLTARQLATELEVSERTIYRDLTALCSAGIPVYTRGGPGGGCFLVEEYRTNLTGMTSDQARALFALSIPTPLDQLGLSQDLKAALLKISATLPSTSRSMEEENRQRLFLDWGHDKKQAIQPTYLHDIQQAVWKNRMMRISFRSLFSPWIDPLEQVVCPYSLVAWAGEWYAVCHWNDSLHVIRIDLVEKADMLPESFQRPLEFDLPAFWKDWRRHLVTDNPVYSVKVRVRSQLVPFLTEWHPETKQNNDWETGMLYFESFERARARLLSYGGAVEILEPEALRLCVLDYAQQILSVYK